MMLFNHFKGTVQWFEPSLTGCHRYCHKYLSVSI